jgi:streptogramin lyase
MCTPLLTLLLTLGSTVGGGSFSPGDVLISRWSYGSPGTLLHYDSSGALLNGGIGSGHTFFGVAPLPSGRVAVTAQQPSRVHVFDGSGAELSTFALPQVTGVFCGDLAAFADGTFAVCDQGGDVDLYSRSGVYVTTWSAPGMSAPYGAYVDGEDRLWVSDLGAISLPGGAIFAFDRAGHVVHSWPLAFEPGDLVAGPAGDVWTVDQLNNLVVHLDAGGQVMASFAPQLTGNLQGIALNGDGSLWVCAYPDARARRFSAAGVQLDEFVVALGVGWAALLAVFPEPIPPTNYCTAGTTTNGCTATLSAAGTPSASLAARFELRAEHVEGRRHGMLFYSTRGAVAAPWGNGGTSWLCVQQPLQRTLAGDSGGTLGSCDGVLALDFRQWANSHRFALGQPFVAGETVRVQAWFRDPGAVKTTSLSDALVFSFAP